MRLATVQTDLGPRACGVRPDGSGLVDLNAVDPAIPPSVRLILALGADGLRRVALAIARNPATIDPVTAAWLAPVPDPSKIICLGLNYRDHAAESKMDVPAEPILFSKYPSTLVGHGGDIVLPPVSEQVDYEAELVAVIGTPGKNIAVGDALSHVAGYAAGHDVSARDWQLNKPGKQWMAGKTFDTFAPIGPHLVTADEVGDPHELDIRLKLNGATMQDANTRDLIFRIDFVISYLSRIMTLTPGDLIFTGTPPGVGMARTPPVWLKPRDVVEVEIQGVGTLRSGVVAG